MIDCFYKAPGLNFTLFTANSRRTLLLFCLISHIALMAQKSDTTLPKHYFKNVLYFDYYGTSKVLLPTDHPKKKIINKRLKDYQFVQKSGGFLIPFYTKDFHKQDSMAPANIHLLATGNYLLAEPAFSGINNHRIFKGGIGIRGIYNSGRKSIWFVDWGLFTAQDITYPSKAVIRSVSTIIYNRIVNERFSFRLGFSKTFLYGNRLRLPYIGLRIGRLDKVNFSIQFPRNITLNIPMGEKFSLSLYSKPMGGVYTFSNNDSLYFGSDKKFQLGRKEFIGGIRFNFIPGQNFSFYLSTGIANNRGLEMSSFSYNANKIGMFTPFYREQIAPALFINFGISIKFGKVRKVYNNLNLYEAFDLNNTIDPGDNNTYQNNTGIPNISGSSKIKNLSISDIQDLMSTDDLE